MISQEHIPRIVQTIVALPLLVVTLAHWNDNHIGQNTINFSTAMMWVVGFDHLVVPYRWLIDKQSYEYELTVIVGALFMMGRLFEKFNPTPNDMVFNAVCTWHFILVLGLNLLFFVLLLLTIFLYACRQVYRLQTETLLSTSQNLEPEELMRLMEGRRQYR